MMKIITFSLIVAAVLCSLIKAFPVYAKNTGYEGLIAPAPESSTSTDSAPKQDAQEYDGLIAPTPIKKRAVGNYKKQPLGYSGLIPGRSEKPPPQMTKIPGTSPQAVPRTSDDIKALARIYGHDRNNDLVPDALRKPKLLSKNAREILAGPRTRIKGKLPMVYMIEQKIKTLMSQVENENISQEVRTKNAYKAYNELSFFAEGLMHKKTVPDNIYRQMGLSEIFIEEDKTGSSDALKQLNETLKKLRKYE